MSSQRRDRQDIDPLQGRAGERTSDLAGRRRQARRLDKVSFCQGDEAAPQAEQINDRQMFQRLRLDALVSGDGQEDEIDPACACEHRMDEPFMSGNVDEA